jgi:hypothetical protein
MTTERFWQWHARLEILIAERAPRTVIEEVMEVCERLRDEIKRESMRPEAVPLGRPQL